MLSPSRSWRSLPQCLYSRIYGFAAVIHFETYPSVLFDIHVHESLDLRKDGFPYAVFVAFSCPVFSIPCNFVLHFHVLHFQCPQGPQYVAVGIIASQRLSLAESIDDPHHAGVTNMTRYLLRSRRIDHSGV